MKTFSLLAAGTAALALASLATPSNATLRVAFSDGAAAFTCADQTACDLDGAASNLLLLNTIVGDIKIVGTFATSVSGNPNELTVSNLTITNLSTSKTETLLMAVGDTGFQGPVTGIRSSASLTFTNDTGGSGTLSFFADPANTQPALFSTDLPGFLEFATTDSVTASPDSFAGTKNSFFSALGLFSMAEGASLVLGPGASITGFNEAMETTVPETSTWVMMGLGFGLMGLAVRAKRRRDVALAA